MARRVGTSTPRMGGRRIGPARPAVSGWRGTASSPPVRLPPGTAAAGVTRLVLAALASVTMAGCGVQTGGEMPSPGPGVPVPVHSGPPAPFEGGTYVGTCGKSAGTVTVTNTGNVGERVLVKITWLGHPPAVEQRTVRLPFGATMQVRFRLHASASVRKLLQGGCEYSAVVTGVFGKPRRLRLRLLMLRPAAGGIGTRAGFCRTSCAAHVENGPAAPSCW